MEIRSRAQRAALAVSILVTLAVAGPATAAPVSFGPNLDAVAANDIAAANCGAGQPDLIFKTTGHTCMWSHLGSGSDSLFAPASGVVKTIRVKVGATTGPMRVNVIRFLFRQTGNNAQPSSAGPFLEAYGPQFTPTPNSVFSVAVNLSLKEDPTPAPTDTQTIQVIDGLALEMLDPTTPIPLFADNTALSYYSYPGPTEAGVPAPSPNGIGSATFGYGVEMNADMETDAGAPTVPTPNPGATPHPDPTSAFTPAFGFPAKLTAPVAANTATVPVQCLVLDCSGQLTLQSAKPAAAKTAKATSRKPAIVSYGSAKFTAKAGKTAKVKVKLNTRGRALLKKHTTAKVWAYATFTKGNGAAKSAHITLKRPK